MMPSEDSLKLRVYRIAYRRLLEDYYDLAAKLSTYENKEIMGGCESTAVRTPIKNKLWRLLGPKVHLFRVWQMLGLAVLIFFVGIVVLLFWLK